MKLNKEQRELIIRKAREEANRKWESTIKTYVNSEEGIKQFKEWKTKQYPYFEKAVKFFKDNKIKGVININNKGYINSSDNIEKLKNTYIIINKYNIADDLGIKRFDAQKARDFLILKSIETKNFNLEELVKELVNL